jgi:sec-independent protein translocase protein TatA
MTFIGPWEIALILLIVLILFGPKKLPELAKSVGQAVREYKRASEGVMEELSSPTIKPSVTQEKPTQNIVEEKEKKALIEAAKKLGIETEGKTIEQISEEIMKKAEETSKQ